MRSEMFMECVTMEKEDWRYNAWIGMLDGYVDNVRQKSTCLRYGSRWDTENSKFEITEDARQEDLRKRKEMKESSNARMVRVCLPAINQVKTDLVFTAEIPEDFQDSKLPSLDFFWWLDRNGLLNHSFSKRA